MSDNITRQDEFLLMEYESATALNNYIDELRNKLTGFYLTFAGVAVAGSLLFFLLQDASYFRWGQVTPSAVTIPLTIRPF
jgi:hypothetical protein